MQKEKPITKLVKISELKLLHNNPRQISKENFWARPVLANNKSGENVVYAGNQRLRAAKAIGMKEVPCIIETLSDEKEKERTIRDNVELGEWDFDLLANEYEVEDLAEWGVELPVVEVEPEEGLTDPDSVPEAPKTPKTIKGDLYELGDHRLLCGDSTIVADAEKLMDGELAEMVFTDPPWNVNYGDVKKGNAMGYKPRTILNDFMGTDDFKGFMNDVFSIMNVSTKSGGMVYVVMSAQEWGNMMLTLTENAFHWSSTIIWNKSSLVLSRKDYHTKYEPIWYGWKEGESRLHPLADRKQSDVWDIDRPSKSAEHPTMKPVELVVRAVENSSKQGDIVLDLFGGSGTTMLACQKTKRKARLMELDEKYCDVIVKRWLEFTGADEFKLNGEIIKTEKWNS